MIFLVAGNVIGQTTATNFTCNDCSGNSHTLFTELNAGKVIALVWVMPCATCVGPSLTTYNVVQTYTTGCTVEYWLVDDYANTSCTTLNNWANSNGLTNSLRFSNSVINMNDYGSTGMPKVVIVGGPSHKVYYNANNSVNSTTMQTAINLACADIAAGISESKTQSKFQLNVFPNPVTTNQITVTYNFESASDISMNIYNVIGEKVKNIISSKNMNQGKHTTTVDCSDLPSGVYMLNILSGNKSEYVKLIVQ